MMADDGLLRIYMEWADALTNWRLTDIRAGVSLPEFRSILPGVTRGLTLSEFVAEMERRRSAFSDFGRNVTLLSEPIVSGNVLVAHYNMTVTHDGELGWMGGNEVLRPTYKEITFPSVDIVTFNDEGLIVRHTVVSDRLITFLAMNGMTG